METYSYWFMGILMIRKIRLSSEYTASPLFDTSPENLGHIEIQELGVSTELETKLVTWDESFKRTYYEDYPPDSGFHDQALVNRHNAEGAHLCELIKMELGDAIQIEYGPLKE